MRPQRKPLAPAEQQPLVIRARERRRGRWAAVVHVAADFSLVGRGASSAEAIACVLPRLLEYLDRTGSSRVPSVEITAP
jgi:hypothetical protein